MKHLKISKQMNSYETMSSCHTRAKHTQKREGTYTAMSTTTTTTTTDVI